MSIRENALILKWIENDISAKVIDMALTNINILRSNPQEGGTPIDTGWASSNWIPSIAEPILSTAGSSMSIDNNSQEAGIASLLTWSPEKGDIWIVNNVPYIVILNEGHSTQAPAGFVERSIEEALKKF